MKEIELTQGHVAVVDDEDYDLVNQYLWQIKRCLHTFYASGWVGENKKKKRMTMHRFIMGLATSDGVTIDHEDHNGLNNQKENLRICNQFHNMKNRLSVINSSSKYKGVHWHKRDKVWAVQIKADGKRFYLGNFKKEQHAAEAYNKAALKYHGEFARLNEINGGTS